MTKIDRKNLKEDEYQKYVYAIVKNPLRVNGKKEVSIFKPLLKQINEDNYKIVLSEYEEQLKDYISREKLETAFDFSKPDIIDLLKHSIDAQFTYQEFLDYIKKNYEIQKDGKDYHSDFAKEVLRLLGYDAIVDDKVYISNSVLGNIKRSNIILLNEDRLIDSKVDKSPNNTLKMIPSLIQMTEEEKNELQNKIDEMFTVSDGDVRYGNFVTRDGKVLDTLYHDMISSSGVKLWDAMGLLGNVRFTTYDMGYDFNFIQMYKKPTEQAINKLMDIVNNDAKNTWLVMWDYDNPEWEERINGNADSIAEPKLFEVPSIKNQAEFVSAINAYYSKEKGTTKYFLTNKTTIDEYRSSSLDDRDSLFKNVKNGNYRTFFVDAVNTKRAIALSKMFYREANQFEINRANEIINKHKDSLPQEQIDKNKESVVISDELVDLAIKELKNSGGFSINQDKLIVNPEWKKQEAEKGYITEGKKYVAVRHVTEVSNKDFDENNKEQFKEYLINAFASVRFSDEYVGGWVDNGKIFIDISVGLEGDSQRIDTHKIASIIGNKTFTTSGDTEYSYYDAKTGMFIKLNQDKTPEKFIYNVFGGAFINSPDTILNEVEKNKELKITRNSFNQTAVEAGLWAVIDKKVDKLVENGEMTHIVASDKQALEYARKKVGITLEDTNEQAIEKLRTAKIQLLEKIDSDLRLDKNDFGLGVYLLQKFNEYKRSNDFIEVLAGMDEVYVQYGQGIQSATLVNKLSAEGQLIVLKRMIKKINDTYQKMNKDVVVKFDSSLVDKLLGETDLERIARIVDEIKDDIASQMPASFMDKVNAWRYLSMLGSPKTHIRNILGNMTMIPMMATKNVLGIALEKMIPQSDRVKSVLNRASSKDVALMDFARKTFDEYSVGSYNLGLSKTNKYSERNDLDQRRQIFKTEALEGLRVFIGDALSNVDDWFARKHFVAEFAMAMKAKGLTEETITEEQTLALSEYSMQQSKIATYNDANNLAKTLNKIEKSGGMGGFLVATTLPFKRTPLNILRRAVEFSPFGIVSGLNMFRGLTTGKYTVTQVVDRLASGLTGTGLMFVGAYLYQTGLLTVGADDDESEKERIYGYALGKQRYSIVVDGKSYTIDWLAPAVIPIIMGGELQKLMSENENGLDSIFNYAPEVLAGTFDPIFELTLLRGLSDTLNSYKQGAGVVSDMLTTASANYVTQFVPTILGQVARSIDDTVRSTYVPNKDTLSGIVDETVRKIKSRIPYLSTENEPMIDIRGQEITQGGTLFTRLLQNMLSPSYIKEQKITNVDREILRLMEITDKTTVIPRFPSKTVTIDGTDYPLTSEEYTKFSKDLGQTSYDILNELIYNKEYNRMSTEDKENIFYDVYNYASAYSKYELNKGYSDTSYEKIKNAEDYGIKTVDYLITKRVYDTLTSDDTMSKKEKFTNYLMATGHKDDYILYLWLVGGYKIGE